MTTNLEHTYDHDVDALKRFINSPGALLRETADGMFCVHRGYRRRLDMNRDDVYFAVAASFGGNNRADDFLKGRFDHSEMITVCDWLRECFWRDRERCGIA